MAGPSFLLAEAARPGRSGVSATRGWAGDIGDAPSMRAVKESLATPLKKGVRKETGIVLKDRY